MLNMRPLYSDEAFEVNGYGFIFTNDVKNVLKYSTYDVVWADKGWAFYYKTVYYPVCVVAGKPGHWYLYYYHREKGLLKERIAVPRAARYRIMQLVEENSA